MKFTSLLILLLATAACTDLQGTITWHVSGPPQGHVVQNCPDITVATGTMQAPPTQTQVDPQKQPPPAFATFVSDGSSPVQAQGDAANDHKCTYDLKVPPNQPFAIQVATNTAAACPLTNVTPGQSDVSVTSTDRTNALQLPGITGSHHLDLALELGCFN
jgi:hypothetical protein